MRSRLIIAFVIRKRIKIIFMKNHNIKNLIKIHDLLQLLI